MPRRAIGDRPLTPAERQAHQREKHQQAIRAAQQALARAYQWIGTNVAPRSQPVDLLNEISDAMGALAKRGA